jgi:phosphohistidine swiveling domain-containing protein
MKWYKLAQRDGIDVTTLSDVDRIFYKYFNEFYENNTKEYLFTLFKNNIFQHYICIDTQGVGKSLYKKHFSSYKDIEKLYQQGEVLRAGIVKDAKQCRRMLERDFDGHIQNAFTVFEKSYEPILDTYSVMSWLAIEAWQNDFNDVYTKFAATHNIHDKEVLSYITKPVRKTALYMIGQLLATGTPLEEIQKEYEYLRSWSLVWYRPLSAAWFRDLEVNADDSPAPTADDVLKRLARYALTDAEKYFFTTSPYIHFFKDYRDDLRRFHVYQWHFLFERIAAHKGIDVFDLGYVSIDELRDWINGKDGDYMNIIAYRKKNPVVFGLRDGLLRATHDVADYIEQVQDDEDVRTYVQGVVASPGIVEGKAVVLKTYHDIKKVQSGDILIANTTDPTYLPAMKKAAAVVTNEGRLTSHAAIVSRELKIPCVVATKNATSVFSNGDTVRVDADEGIVTKL